MGCGGSSMTKEQSKYNAEIDNILRGHKIAVNKEVKLLLLGPGESGKSTIFKQMKMLQDDGGFTPEELEQYKYAIYTNCLTQITDLIKASKQMDINLTGDVEKKANGLLKLTPATGESWSREIGEKIGDVWEDEGIRKAFDDIPKMRHIDVTLNDSARYFLDNIERVTDPDYVPHPDDVLHVRIRSTGIEEAEFCFGGVNFRMVDVGGQRSERRKWIHAFDNVTAVIFCVALNEYDMTLREARNVNRMKESLVLFEEICNSHWFSSTTFILFLNKTDLFQKKVEEDKIALEECFDGYEGGDNYENASQFIKQRFLELNQSPHTVFTHFTCAINKENMKFVFGAVRDSVLKKVLKDAIEY